MISRLTNVQRVYLVIAMALLLPSIAFFALWTYNVYSNEADAARRAAADAADDMVLLADAKARSDLDVLRVLSRSVPLRTLDREGGRNRSLEVLSLVDGWNAILLSDRATGAILFQASREGLPPAENFASHVTGDVARGGFGGVSREGAYCPCVELGVSVPGHSDIMLTALVDPSAYQSLMRASLPGDAVAAIVDREGRFLARSIDYFDRVGTPATSFVLNAVEQGGRGIYEGRTYEGLVNYTAYTTSDLTGWSSHVAISLALLQAPMRLANTFLVAGALGAIAGAALLLLVALRDVAMRRQEASQLFELQRAEAVATFTATVIHDFRNVISTVTSGLRLIRRKTRNDEIKSHVEMIEKSVEKGSRLANHLLSFSAADSAEREAVCVRSLLTDLEFMVTHAVGPGVRVVLEAGAEDVQVSVNQDQLELAIINLAMNASDAMNGEGRFRIRTSQTADTVELNFSDTGPGVAVDRRQSIFAAFETDKPKGTGLGLAQVSGMARQAGGRVYVTDAEGGGAQFVIVLPKVTNVVPVNFEACA